MKTSAKTTVHGPELKAERERQKRMQQETDDWNARQRAKATRDV